ncbi:MAG: hypothetical protein LBV72_07020 [Tannerella sp.]|jgi:hypothetical protein|nr:hypothetical protein [Tannerella sp.]
MNVLNKYINQRYNRWLDYAKFHCARAGKEDEAGDVLHEAIISLMSKSEDDIEELYLTEHGIYRSLDFYILRIINLSVNSETSSYRCKHRMPPIDENIDYEQLYHIPDEEDIDEENENDDYVLKSMSRIREIFDELTLTDLEYRVFHYYFICNEPLSEWTGGESKSVLYSKYKIVREAIAEIIHQEDRNKCSLVKTTKDKKTNERIKEILIAYYQRKSMFAYILEKHNY